MERLFRLISALIPLVLGDLTDEELDEALTFSYQPRGMWCVQAHWQQTPEIISEAFEFLARTQTQCETEIECCVALRTFSARNKRYVTEERGCLFSAITEYKNKHVDQQIEKCYKGHGCETIDANTSVCYCWEDYCNNSTFEMMRSVQGPWREVHPNMMNGQILLDPMLEWDKKYKKGKNSTATNNG
ncbi:hypothetical protein Tcan_05450 [Toxocara canis]|uniref:Uncharacterized protein n=1 Tax=Toxocara canis TaxID=6265 RepID=A0A0B2VQS6_TOXCA|nr:hypothetical protein Tcan_05450 [Toxocara canis]